MIVAEHENLRIIEMWPHESECCVCGKSMVGCKTAIAMYEGCPVPDDWKGDWAGFDACQECFRLHELRLLPMWPNSPKVVYAKKRPMCSVP